MKIKLKDIGYTRSGDKGANSNVGIIFKNNKLYDWAKDNLTDKVIKNYYSHIIKGSVIRYELDNILALNFILNDSLGGGGSESLINDCQGKTHGQMLLELEIDIPKSLLEYIPS